MAGLSDDIDAAVDRLYAAATGAGDGADWTAALDALLRATGFDGAALYVWDKHRMTLGPGTPSIIRGLWHKLNSDGQDDYAQHWFKLDPRVSYMLANPQQRILHDYLHTPEAEIDRHPYYAWYQRSQGTRYYVGGQADPALPFLAGLTLHRRHALGPPGPEELRRFARLFGHVERALLTEFRLQHASAASVGFEGVIERNPNGVMLLGEDGRVVYSNGAARAMAARADGFTLGERLRALRPADDALLQRSLTGAARGEASAPVRLPRRGGGRDYVLAASPVPRGARLFQPFRAAICATVVDPDNRPEPEEAALRRLFGLTKAEARLLALLATGCNVTDAALRLGVTEAAVRFHLAGLFRKTGTGRQAELVRLVASQPWSELNGG